MFNRRRAIGLDIGPAAVRALGLEGRPGEGSITATAAGPVAPGHLHGAAAAATHLGRPDPRELLVALDVGEERAVLCLLSDRGPVVVRHLDVGASATGEQLRGAVRRVADEIRTSLAFYRSEYDRESLPRYLLSGWLRMRELNRWLTDELRLESPFEVIDPFRAIPVTAARGQTDESAGPEFVQAFGLALRAL